MNEGQRHKLGVMDLVTDVAAGIFAPSIVNTFKGSHVDWYKGARSIWRAPYIGRALYPNRRQ